MNLGRLGRASEALWLAAERPVRWTAAMGLGRLGDFGEPIGGLGVIASLIFVGFQIRQNTRALGLANYREVAAGILGSLAPVRTDPHLAEISLRGLGDLESLNPVERYQFDILYLGFLLQFEQACLAAQSGAHPTEQLEPFRRAIAAWIGTPGGTAWWRQRRLWFGSIAPNAIDEVLADSSLCQEGAGPPPAA